MATKTNVDMHEESIPSRVHKMTSVDPSGSSEGLSVQGTIDPLPHKERKVCFQGPGIENERQLASQHNLTRPLGEIQHTAPNPRLGRMQQIQGRERLFQPVARNIGRAVPIGTSCHNRFREMVGRGRGRNNTHARSRGVSGRGNMVWRLGVGTQTGPWSHQILTTGEERNTTPKETTQ